MNCPLGLGVWLAWDPLRFAPIPTTLPPPLIFEIVVDDEKLLLLLLLLVPEYGGGAGVTAGFAVWCEIMCGEWCFK